MKYLLTILLFVTLPVVAQKTLQASFGVHQHHQYVFQPDGICREIFAGKQKDSVLLRPYTLENNRIVLEEEYDGIFIPFKYFVLTKDSSLLDLEQLNTYPISTSGRIGMERRMDLLRNRNLNTALDLQVKELKDSAEMQEDQYAVRVQAVLVNKGTDTIRVLEMTCSIDDFFTSSSQENKVMPVKLCYSNYPVIVAIPPKDSVSYEFLVKRSKRETMLRIGFYALSPNEYLSERDLCRYHYQNRKEGELIWSNLIHL